MTEPMPGFRKPLFAELLASYRTEPTSVHECKVVDPTLDAVNTCAARMSEALVVADKLVANRAAIAALGSGRGDGTSFLLGKYGYGRFGKLCPHGIGRGPQDLAAFLHAQWGARTLGWTPQPAAPDGIQGKTGIVVFLKVPGYSGQGHIDLWNKTKAVGHDYWSSETIWFWELA